MFPLLATSIASVLIISASIPLILRRIPKNDLYGLRTKTTMSGTDEEWYEANRRAGIYLCAAGVVVFAVCLCLWMFRVSAHTAMIASTAALLGGVLLAALLSSRKAPRRH